MRDLNRFTQAATESNGWIWGSLCNRLCCCIYPQSQSQPAGHQIVITEYLPEYMYS